MIRKYRINNFAVKTIYGNYTQDDLKIINDPSKIEDRALEFIYALDMEEFPCKNLIGEFYPFLCIWDGKELIKTNIPHSYAINNKEVV